MREIKFRAWDKKSKTMVDSGDIASCAFLLNDNYDLMQYIGLKDKNGKDIYEGDIVKRTDKIIYGVVEYKHHLFYMHGIDDQDDYFLSKNNYYQVIGNIYENPDLIKN